MPKSRVDVGTYNVNGVNGRIEVLLAWLKQSCPHIVCLQELKAPDDRFPAKAIRDAGYDCVWHGQARWNGVAILSRIGEPVVTRTALPGDPDLTQSRYIEAAIDGIVIGSLYAPNGNPKPGPRFDYKLAWLRAFAAHAETLKMLDAPVVLIGDYNIIPTPEDVYKPERWVDDGLFAPEARAHFEDLVSNGWSDALFDYFEGDPPFTFWKYWRNSFERDAGMRIDHALLNGRAKRALVDARVDRFARALEKTSDHAPVVISLKA